jgi:hypothetical protein
VQGDGRLRVVRKRRSRRPGRRRRGRGRRRATVAEVVWCPMNLHHHDSWPALRVSRTACSLRLEAPVYWFRAPSFPPPFGSRLFCLLRSAALHPPSSCTCRCYYRFSFFHLPSITPHCPHPRIHRHTTCYILNRHLSHPHPHIHIIHSMSTIYTHHRYSNIFPNSHALIPPSTPYTEAHQCGPTLYWGVFLAA